jgi:hypothetical protein
VPRPDHRNIRAACGIDLRAAEIGEVHAAARAQIVEILVREYRRRAGHDRGIAARMGNRRRLRLDAAGDVNVSEMKIVRALGKQAGEHGQCRVDPAERDLVRTNLAREVDDDVRERRPGHDVYRRGDRRQA